MVAADLAALSPFLVLMVASVVTLLVVAFYRRHAVAMALSLLGLALAFAALFAVPSIASRQVTSLFLVDDYALFFMGLLFATSFAVVLLSYGYLEKLTGQREEYYLLLLLATLGSAVLAASTHFASFFLGLEILSVSLYALIAYRRGSRPGIEAGLKYLILAGVSSAFLLFGMALIYADLGTMEFARIASQVAARPGAASALFLAGSALLLVGLGFKLAVVPFHLWTPDVYQGAPAPASAFVATVSKGGAFAVLLRFFTQVDLRSHESLFVVVAIIAIASMFVGNLLALLQGNVKRLLAYSSIAHLGYLLVAVLATGALATSAAAFYLVSYFVAKLGAFGVVAVLSEADREAESLEDYRALFWRHPWLAGVFTAMLLSLAGLPLTIGFLGKFYLAAAGVGSTLWALVIALVLASAIGLFYYLRLVAALYGYPPRAEPVLAPAPALSTSGSLVLAVLTILLLLFGVFPGPLTALIQATVGRLG